MQSIRRFVGNGDGVIIHDAVNGILAELLTEFHIVEDGSEVIPDVDFTGGLNARENSLHAEQYTRGKAFSARSAV